MIIIKIKIFSEYNVLRLIIRIFHSIRSFSGHFLQTIKNFFHVSKRNIYQIKDEMIDISKFPALRERLKTYFNITSSQAREDIIKCVSNFKSNVLGLLQQ